MRIRWIGRGVAELAFVNAHENRLVADEFRQHRRFIVDGVQDEMLFPFTRFALWIFIPVGLGAGEADGHDILPAITVEVTGEFEERIGVDQRIKRLHRLERVLDREIRPITCRMNKRGDDDHLYRRC